MRSLATLIIAALAVSAVTACEKQLEGGKTATDLSQYGTANCYIVPAPGKYSFDASVKGNGTEKVGGIPASAEVLWESYGTSRAPEKGSVVSDVSYEDGSIRLKAGNDGNAVVALKDAGGEILWSWHLWVCKDFVPSASAQQYFNSDAKVMDRNLGATIAARGVAESLGLYYQWGRKDPFPCGMDSRTSYPAASSVTWPKPVASDSEHGTIEYSIANPMTFLTYNSSNYDWLFTGAYETDCTRWGKDKTIYDPCPPGWKVPEDGLWVDALGSAYAFPSWDEENRGWNFGGLLGEGKEIWYPAAGFQMSDDGSLAGVGDGGFYWSSTPGGYGAFYLNVYSDSYINPSDSYDIANCHSVRCIEE